MSDSVEIAKQNRTREKGIEKTWREKIARLKVSRLREWARVYHIHVLIDKPFVALWVYPIEQSAGTWWFTSADL